MRVTTAPDASSVKSRRRDFAKQQRDLEILRLRTAGLSYRAIAEHPGIGLSHVRVKQIIDDAIRAAAEEAFENAAALLGLELDRMDSMIRRAHAVILGPGSTVTEKLRAMEIVRRCSESRVRWLGLAELDRGSLEAMSRADVHRGELAGLEGEALDRELKALGVLFADDA
jgi:hypothetical protein